MGLQSILSQLFRFLPFLIFFFYFIFCFFLFFLFSRGEATLSFVFYGANRIRGVWDHASQESVISRSLLTMLSTSIRPAALGLVFLVAQIMALRHVASQGGSRRLLCVCFLCACLSNLL